MNFQFSGKRISGILTVVPERVSKFDDEVSNYAFSAAKCQQLKKTMGFDRHRLVDDRTCASDLCVYGLEHLLRDGILNADEIDALLLVTQCPDHFIPPTSNLIQGRLGLKNDMLCLDINQGCAGFVIGLMQAFLLLEQASIQKVVLLTADTLSRKACPRDRNIFPMVGDAAAITIVESAPDDAPIFANVKMDGGRAQALMIPAGGFRQPASPDTAQVVEVGDNNWRSSEHFFMNGAEVFHFVQTEVPPMIESLCQFAGRERDEIDYFIFHQPNKFMLEKLADKLQVSRERMPNNVVPEFGNASSATIPTCLCSNLGDRLTGTGRTRLCLAGFGVGLTWSSMLIDVGGLSCCQIIEYPDAAQMRQAA